MELFVWDSNAEGHLIVCKNIWAVSFTDDIKKMCLKIIFNIYA